MPHLISGERDHVNSLLVISVREFTLHNRLATSFVNSQTFWLRSVFSDTNSCVLVNLNACFVCKNNIFLLSKILIFLFCSVLAHVCSIWHFLSSCPTCARLDQLLLSKLQPHLIRKHFVSNWFKSAHHFLGFFEQ